MQPPKEVPITLKVIDTLMQHGQQNNHSLASQAALFKTIQKLFAPQLPSFHQSMQLTERLTYLQLREYPYCKHGCTLHDKPFGLLTDGEKRSIKCSVCSCLFIHDQKRLSLANTAVRLTQFA